MENEMITHEGIIVTEFNFRKFVPELKGEVKQLREEIAALRQALSEREKEIEWVIYKLDGNPIEDIDLSCELARKMLEHLEAYRDNEDGFYEMEESRDDWKAMAERLAECCEEVNYGELGAESYTHKPEIDPWGTKAVLASFEALRASEATKEGEM